MHFKVKDLMISTLGDELCNPASLQGPLYCGPACSLNISCQPYTNCGCSGPSNCGCPTNYNGGHSMHLEGIEEAKAQMKARLAQLESYQKSIEESLKPATIGDVETLEVKLNEALRELATRKKELQQKK